MTEQPQLLIDEDGVKEWFLNGDRHRIDGPALEYPNGNKEWYINGKFHRTDGPAIECANGNKYWYINGKLHREDGPAVEYANGNKYWFLNGQEYTYTEWKAICNPFPIKHINTCKGTRKHLCILKF